MKLPELRISRPNLGRLLFAIFCLSPNFLGCDTSTAKVQSQTSAKTDSTRNEIKDERPSDYFVDEDSTTYEGYQISKRVRRAQVDFPREATISSKWVDVAYVVVERSGKLVARFDADYYFGEGNLANFGYFPFLPGKSKQLFVSQDVFRGGCQWIAKLSPRFKVIFDGKNLGVGREGPDLTAIDIDRDGTYEIVAPITDFYTFQDKMSISRIPLPGIVFKYDTVREEYLPANSTFKEYAMKEWSEVPDLDRRLQNEFDHRSAVLSNLLTLVYAGEEERGWDFFDRHYQLTDKLEIKRRVKITLKNQRVYNLIYSQVKRK